MCHSVHPRYACETFISCYMCIVSVDVLSCFLYFQLETCSFLAGILAWKDPHVLVPALQIADVLMEKLPDTFSKMFVREGVVHAVDQLILVGNSISGPPQASSTEKDNECITSASSRSRRYRRRCNNTNIDGSAVEESKNPILSNTVSPPSSSEIPNVNTNLRSIVSTCAKAFKDKYFPSDPGVADVGVTDDLLRLKNLCTKLNLCVDDQKTKLKGKSKSVGSRASEDLASKDETLNEIIAEMMSELGKGDGVSTFEFIGSGVVGALLNYFSCGYFFKERITEANISRLRQQALRRYKLFVAIALPPGTTGMNPTPMAVLVQKLQSSLLSLERFPVVLSHSSRSSGSGRISSGLSALSHPFKLRLSRASSEKSLRDYSSNIVLIDPLETLAAVEEFLWPRVQRGESVQKTSASVANSESGLVAPVAGAASPSSSVPTSAARRPSTRSRSSVNIGDTNKRENAPEKSSGSSKGKGKAVLKPAQEEGMGPQTRNATRRRAVLDKDAEVKQMNGDSSSEVADSRSCVVPFVVNHIVSQFNLESGAMFLCKFCEVYSWTITLISLCIVF